MKKILQNLSIFIVSIALCSMQGNSNVGSLSVNYNGNAWNCSQIGASVANFNGNNWLQIHVQNEKIEFVLISILRFSGKGTYEFGRKGSPANLTISYQNKRYVDNPKLGGSGTIKVIEYIPKAGAGKGGKIVGEFSGTLKDASGNTITITNGKFNSTMVL
jgi:hypothetical protein